MSFECPKCKAETNKLVIFEHPVRFLGCPQCGTSKQKAYNVNLGQTSDKWEDHNGKIRRITVGKQIEMESRVLRDGKMISKDNGGREPQY